MNFPTQWTVAQLGDLTIRIVGGGTPSKALSANFEGAIPFMTVKDMKARFVESTVDHISEEAIRGSATTMVPADTLIVATRMSLGKIVRPKFDVAINQDLKALFLEEEVEKTYIEYFWRSKSQTIQAMGTGTTVKGIRLEDIRTLAVPLAPKNEQKRIVDKLDTVLTRVDAVNTRLARIAPLLKRFRQSVLAAATSGRLTGEWRLANDLSYPQALTLGELIKVSSGDGLTAKEMKSAGGVPVYGGNGINGHHDQSNVSAPTIVIGRVGFYCGSVHLTPSIAWVTDNALRVKFDPTKLDRKYLYFALQGTDLRQNMSSTAQPVISGQKIYPLSFNLPTLLEQTEIVRRVETLFGFADRLEARLQAAQTAADRLTPSLLAKAFRGELVSQDPNDEPASELLKRLAVNAPVSPAKRGRARASK
jgi:type I restriction enzyme, S subunit